MGSYNPPVAGLLKLGRPDNESEPDYTAFGIGSEHIPDLIRMLRDKELQNEEPQWYAHIHAWRALAQACPSDAIEPLLELLAEQEGDDWDDWITEDIPRVLGKIGPPALAATATRLSSEHRLKRVPGYYGEALTLIAREHPDTRDEVLKHLCAFLDRAVENDPSMNGFVIANLLDLEADEVWPTIEAAFATGNVDESIAGDAARVKYELGLGPEPPPRRYSQISDFRPIPWGSEKPFDSGRGNAKQRFNERQRQKKLEKKANKKKRKGK
jgi:hypothetical protein